ncbi:DEMA protein, partial [Rhynochetos jubatus]|nr:DEMA protein [Rhynochetos jubatus]
SQQPLTSPGSVCSSRGSSVPGSPSSIVAKMDNEVLGYKDLAAIPKDKAILDIERPDLMIYEPHFTYSLMEHVELPRSRERSLSPKSISPPPSPEVIREWLESRTPGSTPQPTPRQSSGSARSSVQHFHRPETDTTELNIYKKPPIYRQKGGRGGPPDPNQPAKIETDYWPCPPSLAVVGRWVASGGSQGSCGDGYNVPSFPPPPETEWRKRMASKRGEEEEEDLTEEMKNLRELQRQELSKVRGWAGPACTLPAPKALPAPLTSSCSLVALHMGSYKSSSLPASGRSTLTRVSG